MNAKEIEAVFYQVFFEHYQTVLVGGYTEPFYGCSKKNTDPHRICYRFDYVASALHEVAHWCIAGKNRRKLDDYGLSLIHI